MMAAEHLSPQQDAIVIAAVTGGSFRSGSSGDHKRCTALNSRGFLRRDPKDGNVWYPTDAAMERAGAAGASLPAVAEPGAGMPQILSMLHTAARLFDEGDFQRARVIADASYDQSQAQARFAAKYSATLELVPKFRQLQGDALLLETRCKIELAKAYDAAQKAGSAAGKGRPKNVVSDDIFKQSDVGLTRQEIHDARKLAAAEEKTPGIAERAIAARIAQGLAPTRANLKHAIGTRSASNEERGDNLYETPPEAMHVLLALEQFSPTVWEPACGRGAISRMLEDAGYAVVLSDINDYGTADKDGELQAVVDFRQTEAGDGECHDIVTNPPYGGTLSEFIAHALRIHRPRKMACLLNIGAYFGFEDADRNFIMKSCPPARIIAHARRLPMMHRDGWEGKKATSQMHTAWFIWERQEDGTYGRQTVIERVDFDEFMPAAAQESEAE